MAEVIELLSQEQLVNISLYFICNIDGVFVLVVFAWCSLKSTSEVLFSLVMFVTLSHVTRDKSTVCFHSFLCISPPLPKAQSFTVHCLVFSVCK